MYVGEERFERLLVISWFGVILVVMFFRCEVVCWYVLIFDWSCYILCVLNYVGILIEVNVMIDFWWGFVFFYWKKEVICWCLCVGLGEIWMFFKFFVSLDGCC